MWLRYLRSWRFWLFLAVLAATAGGLYSTSASWLPWAQRTLARLRGTEAPPTEQSAANEEDHEGDAHSHHHGDHDHPHDNATSLALSSQARRAIGLTSANLGALRPTEFMRTITIPGIVAEIPGRTFVQVSTPMAGVITHVHAVRDEAVSAGTLLFELRITAEELVESQTELLKTICELDVERREIERLRSVSESGALPQRMMLERVYAQEKLEALLESQREALRLHGLTDEQVLSIERDRKLLRTLRIYAPSADEHSSDELRFSARPVRSASFQPTGVAQPEAVEDSHPGDPASLAESPLVLQELRVHKGQFVAAGETLCVLADYSQLYVEGRAFEQDGAYLTRTMENGWRVAAMFEEPDGRERTVQGLELLYAGGEIDAASRTLPFYVRLPNEVLRRNTSAEGTPYVAWRYRPGQRLRIEVPVEIWQEQLVLPVEAVARDGAESYAFRWEDEHFDRVNVQVRYRDSRSVVLGSASALQAGDIVALRAANELLLALKNKAGGAVDPHAGHSH